MTETYRGAFWGALAGTVISILLVLLLIVTAPIVTARNATFPQPERDLAPRAAALLAAADARESRNGAAPPAGPAGPPEAPTPSPEPAVQLATATGATLAGPGEMAAPDDGDLRAGPFALLESAFFPTVFAEPVSPAVEPAPTEITPLLETLTPETLRVIAQMTPDQIDALTLLLLSYADGAPITAGTPMAAPEVQPLYEQDAPWIGDWSLSELSDTAAGAADPDAASEPVETLLRAPWVLFEDAAGAVFIELPGYPLSRIELAVGLVLDFGGQVVSIEKSGEDVLVRSTEGVLAIAPRNDRYLAAETARIAEARRRATPVSVPLEAEVTEQAEAPEEEQVAPLAAAPRQAAASAPPASTAQPSGRYVQAGSFTRQQNAQMARAQLEGSGLTVTVRQSTAQGQKWYRVLVQSDAQAGAGLLSTVRGLGFRDAFWTRS